MKNPQKVVVGDGLVGVSFFLADDALPSHPLPPVTPVDPKLVLRAEKKL